MIRRILLLNVGGKNKGNQALIDSTKEIIRNYDDCVDFIDMGSDEGDNSRIIPSLAQSPTRSLSPWIFLIECILIRTLRKLGFDIHLGPKSKLSIYGRVDVVINSGGDQLSGEKTVGSSFLNLLYPILLDRPVVLFAESLGYYKNPLNQIVGQYIFKKVDLILVRESLSKTYLDSIGIDAKKVIVTADPAFILSPAPRSRIDEILLSESIYIQSRYLVGINPSSLISKLMVDSNIDRDRYIRIMAKTIDHIVENMDADVILVPHVYSHNNDDRIVIGEIANIIQHRDRIHLVTQEYSAAELKGIIKLCDLFIGARMHATIAATSLCIPTIGIAYSHKMHGIIGESLGLERYIVDVAQLNETSLIRAVDVIWAERENVTCQLTKKIPEIKAKALSNGYYLIEYLNSNLHQKKPI